LKRSASTPTTGATAAPTTRVGVLLVEDNPVDAVVLRNLLREASPHGYDLSVEGTLAGALSALSRGGVGVVLLDLHLPDSDGIDTAIRMLERAGDVPVIVLTGLDDEETGVLALQEGAQDYLVKGHVAPALLRRAIHYAVQRQDLLSHLREALEEARSSQANLLGILRSASEGAVVVDADGRICFVSPSAERILGEASADLLGRDFPHPLELGARREVDPGDGGAPFGMRTVAVEWSGDPAWLVWLAPAAR
jgi:CheY-like chemotaxis protein